MKTLLCGLVVLGLAGCGARNEKAAVEAEAPQVDDSEPSDLEFTRFLCKEDWSQKKAERFSMDHILRVYPYLAYPKFRHCFSNMALSVAIHGSWRALPTLIRHLETAPLKFPYDIEDGLSSGFYAVGRLVHQSELSHPEVQAAMRFLLDAATYEYWEARPNELTTAKRDDRIRLCTLWAIQGLKATGHPESKAIFERLLVKYPAGDPRFPHDGNRVLILQYINE